MFSDYQCPACKSQRDRYDPVLRRLTSAYPNELVLEHYDFPLEPECNQSLSGELHPLACEAAVAVRVAARHGDKAAFEEYLFSHQSEMNRQTIETLLRSYHLLDEFARDYQRELDEVRKDVSLAVSVGVQSTPVYFVNGIRLQGWSPELLERVIVAERRRRG